MGLTGIPETSRVDASDDRGCTVQIALLASWNEVERAG